MLRTQQIFRCWTDVGPVLASISPTTIQEQTSVRLGLIHVNEHPKSSQSQRRVSKPNHYDRKPIIHPIMRRDKENVFLLAFSHLQSLQGFHENIYHESHITNCTLF